MANPLGCVKLINALSNTDTPGAQRVLAMFVADARLRYFPVELGTMLTTLERPARPLLEALKTRMREFFPTDECLAAASGGCFAYELDYSEEDSREREQSRQTLLLAAAHLAGLKLSSSRDASEPGTRAASQIVATVENLLHHVGGEEDARWERMHAEAAWRAHLHWESFSEDHRHSWIARHMNAQKTSAVEWATANGQYSWHEEHARDMLRKHHLHRHEEYDHFKEQQHKVWIMAALRAVSNGAIPGHEKHAARWMRHRHADIVHAAVDSLRGMETPEAEGHLLEALQAELSNTTRDNATDGFHACGHCPERGYHRSSHVASTILNIFLDEMRNVTAAVMGEAVRHLLRQPHHLLVGGQNKSHDRCVGRCFSGCNPHLKQHCAERCTKQCQHEHTIKDLLRQVVRRGIEQGHDATEWLEAHASTETNPSLRGLLELELGLSIPRSGDPDGSVAYRRRLKGQSVKTAWELVDFNKISLTFLDVLLSLPAIDWKKFYGDKKLFGDWGGLGMGAELTFKNSAWARLGFFGGGFGIYLDNWAWLGFVLGPLRVSIFKAQMIFKADAAFRIDLPVGALAEQSKPFYALTTSSNSYENKTKSAAVQMTAALCALEGPAKAFLTRFPVGEPTAVARAVQTRFAELRDTANTTHVFAEEGQRAVRKFEALNILNRQMNLFLTHAQPYFSQAAAVDEFTNGVLEVKSVRDSTDFLYSLLRRQDSQVLADGIVRTDPRFTEPITAVKDAYASGALASTPTFMDAIDGVSPVILKLLLQLRDRSVANDALRNSLVDGNLTAAIYALARQENLGMRVNGSSIVDIIYHASTGVDDPYLEEALMKGAPVSMIRRAALGTLSDGFGTLALPADPAEGISSTSLDGTAAIATYLIKFRDTLEEAPAQAVKLEQLRRNLEDGMAAMALMARAPSAFGLTANATEANKTFAASGVVGLEALCKSVVDAIKHTIAEQSPAVEDAVFYGRYQTLMKAIAQRRWDDAATVASRSAICSNPNAFSCSNLVSTLRNGCPLADGWFKQPAWNSKPGNGTALLDLKATNIAWQGAATGETSPVPRWEALSEAMPSGATWSRADIQLDASLAASGELDCLRSLGATELERVQVRMVMSQNSVGLSMFVDQAVPGSDASVVWLPRDAMLSKGPAAPALTLSEDSTTAARWWGDYDAPRLAPEPFTLLGESQGPAALCELYRSTAGQPNRTSTIEIDVNATFLTRSTAVAGLTPAAARDGGLLPSLYRVSPLVACYSVCPPGHRLQRTTAPDAGAGDANVTALDATGKCLVWHARDYSTCGLDKAAADAAFLRCMGKTSAVSLDGLPKWWAALLGDNDHPHLRRFDCETFATMQQASCTCHADAAGTSGAALARAFLLPDGGSRIGQLAERIGDHAVTSPADVVVLEERLLELGYLEQVGSDSPTRAHALRAFACATSGTHRFEEACDDGIMPCQVAGVKCTRSTQQDTCLFDLPCAAGSFEPNSEMHDWLRSRNAPAWLELPLAGTGFKLAADNVLARHTTSWVADALRSAGRFLATSNAGWTPLTVATGSVQRGGLLPGVADHQSGLQLRVQLDWASLSAHLDALGLAGFGGFQLKAASEDIAAQPICQSADRAGLCSSFSEAEMAVNATAYLSAALPVPSQGRKMPNILLARTEVCKRPTRLRLHARAHAPPTPLPLSSLTLVAACLYSCHCSAEGGPRGACSERRRFRYVYGGRCRGRHWRHCVHVAEPHIHGCRRQVPVDCAARG